MLRSRELAQRICRTEPGWYYRRLYSWGQTSAGPFKTMRAAMAVAPSTRKVRP